jgi:hypothetical protein
VCVDLVHRNNNDDGGGGGGGVAVGTFGSMIRIVLVIYYSIDSLDHSSVASNHGPFDDPLAGWFPNDDSVVVVEPQQRQEHHQKHCYVMMMMIMMDATTTAAVTTIWLEIHCSYTSW